MVKRRYLATRIIKPGMVIDQAIIDRAGRVLIARKTESSVASASVLRSAEQQLAPDSAFSVLQSTFMHSSSMM